MAKVLLAEDNKLVRFALSKLLRDSGHCVTEAHNGREAAAALQESRFDVVVTDVFMPEVDGIEFIRTLRKSHPDLKVLAISGGGALHPPEFAMGFASSLGANATMQKPVDSDAFLATIQSLVQPAA